MTIEEAVRAIMEDNVEDLIVENEETGELLSIDEVMKDLDKYADEWGTVCDTDSYNVISLIQDNYEEITGNDRSEMYAEQEFDFEVVEIAKLCGVSYDTLCEEW